MLCWHKWSKWSEPTNVQAISTRLLTGEQTKYSAAMQDRTCEKCGMNERKWVKEKSA